MKTCLLQGSRVLSAVAGLVMLLGSGVCAQSPGARFRDLVYKTFEEEGKGREQLAGQLGLPEKPAEFTALEYKVLLLEKGGGAGKYVDPKQHRFKIGDQIRLTVRPLAKSYVYIYHVGASGRGTFLIPREEEQPQLAEPKKELTLPGEGYLEFVPPPGSEVLYVIAAAKPIRDREVLARVVTAKDPQKDTPEMKEQRAQLNAVVQGVIKSEAERRSERNDGSIRYRGLFSPSDQQAFRSDLQQRNATWGSLEIPPENPKEGTLAVGFRALNAPEKAGSALVVTIPLESTGSTEDR